MQIDNQAEPVSKPLSTTPSPPAFDLNDHAVLIQGKQAEQQAVVLRQAFPKATITTEVAQPIWRRRTRAELAIYGTAALSLMVVGHLLFSYLTLDRFTVLATSVQIKPEFFYFLMAGFVAQMIDGALGMAYGVTATTFLMSLGIRDRKSTRLNSSHSTLSRMPSSA